jgi:hypothetical protein
MTIETSRNYTKKLEMKIYNYIKTRHLISSNSNAYNSCNKISKLRWCKILLHSTQSLAPLCAFLPSIIDKTIGKWISKALEEAMDAIEGGITSL